MESLKYLNFFIFIFVISYFLISYHDYILIMCDLIWILYVDTHILNRLSQEYDKRQSNTSSSSSSSVNRLLLGGGGPPFPSSSTSNSTSSSSWWLSSSANPNYNVVVNHEIYVRVCYGDDLLQSYLSMNR